MGLLSRFLGNNIEARLLPKPKLEKRDITYDPNLVHNLKEDHRQIFRHYEAVTAACYSLAFDLIPARLGDLKLSLQAHLVVENVRFYAYVQQQFALDPETSEFIADLREEMDSIGRTARQFVNRYTQERINEYNQNDFKATLELIGAVLTRRIQLEESRLYSLYMP